jgi:ParB family chromosome partitioning protein
MANGHGELIHLPIEKVIADVEFNTRQKGLGDLDELVESIKAFGIKEPLLGKSKENPDDGVEIYAGFRRLEAAKIAGLTTVPVIVVKRREVTKKQMLLINITENVQREDLNPIDEANAYARLQQDHQMSTTDIAQALGIKQRRIEKRFALLKLQDVIRDAVHEGRISITAALEIDRLPREKQGKFLEIAEDLSGKKLELLVNKELEKLQKKIEETEKAPKESTEADPASITEMIRVISKSTTVIGAGLGFDAEKIDRLKAINYRLLDPADLVEVVQLYSSLADLVPDDIDINEKAGEEIISTVESLGSEKSKYELNTESPVFRSWITKAVGDHARELATEKAQGTGKRAKVTYALAEEAMSDFFIKSEK